MKYYNEDGKEISGEKDAVVKFEEKDKVVKAFKKEGVHWENKWTAKNVELSDVHITKKVKIDKKEVERKLRILRGLYRKAEIQQREIQKAYLKHIQEEEDITKEYGVKVGKEGLKPIFKLIQKLMKEYEKIDTIKEGLEKTFFMLSQKLRKVDPENPELEKGIHNMPYIGFGGE